MKATPAPRVSRRDFLRASGLVVGFTLAPRLALGQDRPAPLPGSLNTNRMLDAWLRIDPSGTVTIFTGKIELGQGIGTALSQIAADELDVHLKRIEMIHGDTARTPDEGQTAGSLSVEQSGTALRFACAEARDILVSTGAAKARRAGPRLEGERRDHRGAGRRERDVLGPGARCRLQAPGDRQGEAEAGRRPPVGRPEHPPARHSQEVHGRGRLRAGRATAEHAVRPRGAPALARRSAPGGGRGGGAPPAGRRRRRARRKLPGRRRRARGAGDSRARALARSARWGETGPCRRAARRCSGSS